MKSLIISCIALLICCGSSKASAQVMAHPLGVPRFTFIESMKKENRLPTSSRPWSGRYASKGCEKIQKKRGRYHDKVLGCWAKSIGAKRLETGQAWYHLAQQHQKGSIENASIESAIYFYEISSGVLQGKRCKHATEKAKNFVGEDICLLFRSHGFPASQFELGMLYAHGTQVERDLEAARFWFEAAKFRHLKIAEQALVALDDLEKRIAAMKEKDTDTEK